MNSYCVTAGRSFLSGKAEVEIDGLRSWDYLESIKLDAVCKCAVEVLNADR